jgi:hypothetical protein
MLDEPFAFSAGRIRLANDLAEGESCHPNGGANARIERALDVIPGTDTGENIAVP